MDSSLSRYGKPASAQLTANKLPKGVLRMGMEVRKHIGQIFRGEVAAPPAPLASELGPQTPTSAR